MRRTTRQHRSISIDEPFYDYLLQEAIRTRRSIAGMVEYLVQQYREWQEEGREKPSHSAANPGEDL